MNQSLMTSDTYHLLQQLGFIRKPNSKWILDHSKLYTWLMNTNEQSMKHFESMVTKLGSFKLTYNVLHITVMKLVLTMYEQPLLRSLIGHDRCSKWLTLLKCKNYVKSKLDLSAMLPIGALHSLNLTIATTPNQLSYPGSSIALLNPINVFNDEHIINNNIFTSWHHRIVSSSDVQHWNYIVEHIDIAAGIESQLQFETNCTQVGILSSWFELLDPIIRTQNAINYNHSNLIHISIFNTSNHTMAISTVISKLCTKYSIQCTIVQYNTLNIDDAHQCTPTNLIIIDSYCDDMYNECVTIITNQLLIGGSIVIRFALVLNLLDSTLHKLIDIIINFQLFTSVRIVLPIATTASTWPPHAFLVCEHRTSQYIDSIQVVTHDSTSVHNWYQSYHQFARDAFDRYRLLNWRLISLTMRQIVYGQQDTDFLVARKSIQQHITGWLSIYSLQLEEPTVEETEQLAIRSTSTYASSISIATPISDLDIIVEQLPPWQSIRDIKRDKQLQFFSGRCFYFHSSYLQAQSTINTREESKQLIVQYGGRSTNSFNSRVTDIIVTQFVTVKQLLSGEFLYKDIKKCHLVTVFWIYSSVTQKKLIRRVAKYSPKRRLLHQLAARGL